MEVIRAFKLCFEAVQTALTRNWAFLLLIPLIYALRKIQVRRPRTWDIEELSPDEKPLSRAEKQGQRGEALIAKILYKTVPGAFQVFRNVYVPNNGKTSEIDLVMVHETGIFVFESKNYNGVISGSMDARNWAHIHPNREKYLFYNPVRQNRKHIRALSDYLRIPEANFYSYIVFSKQCKLQRVPDSTRSTVITQTPELGEQLERVLSTFPPLYSAGEIEIISDRLLPLTNVDSSVKEQHIADIRAAQESEICPWCGNTLVLREGRYGVFWGCASYPRCRFTRKAG